jgi:hypothetical protein
MKKSFKVFVIILPYLLIIVFLYIFLERFQIVDKNGQTIYGHEITKSDLSFDESHIFYKNDSVLKISSSKENGIKIENISNRNFIIRPEANPKISINILLKDSLVIEESEFVTSEKIIALSDIEGNFNVFKNFLIQNKITDKNLNWIFGKGHFVCNGDFFDRGNDVTAILWLIYKLENEANKHGGKVHFIIGNHEEMNLRGYVKYTKLKYEALTNQLNIPFKELYGKDTELGRWLRTKNIVVKINDILFTHGGISPQFIERNYNIEDANQLFRKYVGYDNDYIKFINSKAYFLFDRQGPMWYRGYFGDYKEFYKGANQKEINRILKYLNVSKIVVGHSIVDKVKYLFNQKIIAIDVVEENDPRKKDDDNYADYCFGLLIENSKFFSIKSDGTKIELK